MLKTQITGAKYLSPQTNQMTNLNIAIPADSKDTKFGTSDILLAKDVAAYYYTKEETDNLILIAKNSAINIHNEDNTKSIKIDINDTEADDEYGCPVNIRLVDPNIDGTTNINAVDGFTQKSNSGYYGNLCNDGLYLSNPPLYNTIHPNLIIMSDDDANYSIEINTNKYLTEEEQDDGYSPVDISLTDGSYTARINSEMGFTHETDDFFVATLDGYALNIKDATGYNLYATNDDISLSDGKYNTLMCLHSNENSNYLYIGSDEKFKISRPADNSEGATITGVKSITAFANPSATKVWATDGSTVDLTTKANTSDVLLKKSASGGYYIELNSHELGLKAFAANSTCTASGYSSFAEGYGKATSSASHAEGEYATASGYASHAEGSYTVASATSSHTEGDHTQAAQVSAHAEGYYTTSGGVASHAEGYYTTAIANYSHAEGHYTEASGFCAHALGTYNIANKNAIHSVGIGNNTTRKNAEYIYAKNNENGYGLTDDPKNGYKYLIGVGGYDGISTDNTTYKSVQEVIADLASRIEQLETKVRALEAANTPA